MSEREKKRLEQTHKGCIVLTLQDNKHVSLLAVQLDVCLAALLYSGKGSSHHC